MKKGKTILTVIGVLMLIGLGFTQYYSAETVANSMFDELQREGITEITLETDMASLLSKEPESSYQHATVRYQDQEGTAVQLPLKVKTRGNTRKEICDFPPLKLKFGKEALKEKDLKTYNTLKLVSHCKEGEDFEQVLFKEYLAYKMYNTLTDKSFRVQLVKMTYVDTESRFPSEEHYGFIIENKRDMAERLDATVMEESDQPLKHINAQQYRLFTLFQYMIGNTDWNLSKQHNLKLLQPGENLGPIPVPYDFDFAGLVDAPYAKPYPTLPIKDVKERFFQYRGTKNTDFSQLYDLFNDKKSEIVDLVLEFELLDDQTQIKTVNYLLSFFEIINTPQKANVQLLAMN